MQSLRLATLFLNLLELASLPNQKNKSPSILDFFNNRYGGNQFIIYKNFCSSVFSKILSYNTKEFKAAFYRV